MSEDEIEAAAEGSGGTAAAAEIPSPREHSILLGHGEAAAALLNAYGSGRLPHAWLITGPRGIGKATLAFRFGRFLLAEGGSAGGLFAPPPVALDVAPDHPVFRRVASGGHPDLLVVERSYDPRRRRLRSEIVVGDTRQIAGFLRLTPAAGGWRVVILDGADAMNRNAANALLKILEEPPERAVLLLVSDNPGRLLPTIRSRCRRLALRPLPQALVEQALLRHRPELSAADVATLARLAEGSIGRALGLASGDGVVLYRGIFNILKDLPEIEGEALHGFADGVLRGEEEAGFALLGELLPGWVARMVAGAAGSPEAGGISPEETAVMQRLAGRRSLDRWAEVWENLTHHFAEADSINLDRKQVVLDVFFALEAAAR